MVLKQRRGYGQIRALFFRISTRSQKCNVCIVTRDQLREMASRDNKCFLQDNALIWRRTVALEKFHVL